MSDPIDDRLSSFDPGVPMPPLPPSDVRRRGDRMRRRNRGLAVAGAALAVAVVATPLSVLTSGGEAVAPATPPATALAADVDLLAPDEVPARERLQPWTVAEADDVVLACQPGALDQLGADDAVSGQLEAQAVLPEGTTADPSAPDVPIGRIRETVLQFGDAAAADTAYDTVAGWIETCPGDPTGVEGEEREVRDLPVTDGRAQWEQHSFAAPDVCADDCDAARFDQQGVARVEDRLVLLSFAEVGGPLEPELLEASMDTLFATAIEKARADVDDVPAQPTTPDGPSTEIPEGFLLDRGLIELTSVDDYELTGPAPDGPAVFFAEGWCGVDVWPAAEPVPVERLGVSVSGLEYYEARELATFATSDEARSVVALLSSAVVDCPTVAGDTPADDLTFTLRPDTTGFESTTFSAFYAEGVTGNSVYQFTAIGNAVLASVVTSEMSESSADPTARALSRRNAPVLEDVCAFTGAC